MAQQMNPVDPATALILQAMNKISPVTESGQPTVAADVLNTLSQMGATQMSPSVGQAAHQAGIASQLEAMKLQKAQNALMNQAMAQGPEAVGIAPMAGEVRMAEGGIVGYAGREESYVTDPVGTGASEISAAGREGGVTTEELLDKIRRGVMYWPALASDVLASPVNLIRNLTTHGGVSSTPFRDVLSRQEEESKAKRAERSERESIAEEADKEAKRFAQDVPYGTEGPARKTPSVERPSGAPQRAPAADRSPGLAKSTGPTFDELFKEFEKLKGMPTTGTPEAALQKALADKAVENEYIRRQGGNPELIKEMIAEYGSVYGDQLAKIEARRAAAQERAEKGGIGAWLRGFRQMRGQGIGEGFRTATEAGEAFDETMRGRIERLEDLGLEVQRTRMEKVNALKNQKYLTDIGDYRNAMKAGDAAAEAARREQALLIDLKKFQASEYGQEARTAATLASQAADRAAARASGNQAQIEELYRLRLSTLTQGNPPTPEQMMQAREYALQTVMGAGSAARTNIAAGNLEVARQKLAESNEMYKFNRFVANNPKATEAERNRALQNMRDIEAKAGIGGSAPVTGAGGQFKVIDVQPSPR